MQCRVCGRASEKLFTGRLLGKYDVDYFRCTQCGLVQTEEPYWLEESYSDAVSTLDLGPVNRAVTGSQVVENLILGAFDPDASYVDWGGGYGIFTRMMRDNGYDFYWNDKYCENLFARQFQSEPGRQYELLTAFEVFEHLVDPVAEIEQMLAYSRNIFFTTVLVPPSLDTGWWYLAPDTGQHITFYTPAALQILADRFGLQLSSDGQGTHLLATSRIPDARFREMVGNGRIARLRRRLLRRRHRKSSLLHADFRAVTGWNV